MPRSIIISLPVTDLARSTGFYTALGFQQNAQWSDSEAACMTWSEHIQLMLLTHSKWSSFTDRPIAPPTCSEVGLMLSCETRDEVDTMNLRAGENGGIADINPIQDHGTMYGRDFGDPDGHIWGAIWMDVSTLPDA